ncbi:hypothetical protein A2483_03630 [Candidatus Peregrinibacteria bacterium RIFOXYC2_FULL_33_13]|nr:MAG: SAM-binding motif-containing protein [Candidatus Peregrinibacteria bacterium GW2011_GWA2_33_10]KKP38885.1 MAG: type 12 methyltransferase [Candidatus Peregrinibacteria bacterium GW2011_GWC2_33_13]OGJ46709.1 MAG: hypothetical protein A2229_02755 [Candidatus Peregrinibacteria bacterium RIFOXYA2_FULL_33_7]OGJ52881.1 MAG: hypothetical protein A2483_03630 [Candidatus Peregrinibacteria bacterium RIFOXYC2_FULL_33_13]
MPLNLTPINQYYSEKIKKYGDSPKAVDWKNKKTQIIRFQSFDPLFLNYSKKFSVLDYGCGKSDFYFYLKNKFPNFYSYCGVDISENMLNFSRKKLDKEKNYYLSTKIPNNKKFDFIVAIGTFTVKLNFNQKDWQKYLMDEIDKLYKVSKKGIAFNLMTKYVDFEVDHLFYCSPEKLFQELMTKYRYVDIIHSYPLYEYTVIIKKN